MHPYKNLEEINSMFNNVNTKHLPVVQRMVCDINRRMLKEKTISFFKTCPNKTLQRGINKSLTPPRKSLYLGEFYKRLEQDIEKRRVKGKIRVQIRKILEKRKEIGHCERRRLSQPHLPHRFEDEEVEIEKLYGLPGKTKSVSYADEERFVAQFYNFK